MNRRTVIERAFDLADTGQFRTLTELRRALAREGYLDVRAKLDGRYIQHQLQERGVAARLALGEALGADPATAGD